MTAVFTASIVFGVLRYCNGSDARYNIANCFEYPAPRSQGEEKRIPYEFFFPQRHLWSELGTFRTRFNNIRSGVPDSSIQTISFFPLSFFFFLFLFLYSLPRHFIFNSPKHFSFLFFPQTFLSRDIFPLFLPKPLPPPPAYLSSDIFITGLDIAPRSVSV